MAKKPHGRKQGRSSVDGQFVTKKFVAKNPRNTEMEIIPLPGYGLTNRKKKK